MHRLKYKICATAVDLLIFILFFFAMLPSFQGAWHFIACSSISLTRTEH